MVHQSVAAEGHSRTQQRVTHVHRRGSLTYTAEGHIHGSICNTLQLIRTLHSWPFSGIGLARSQNISSYVWLWPKRNVMNYRCSLVCVCSLLLFPLLHYIRVKLELFFTLVSFFNKHWFLLFLIVIKLEMYKITNIVNEVNMSNHYEHKVKYRSCTNIWIFTEQ